MKLITNVPWWLISAGLHAVILMGAALIVIERAFALDTPPIIISMPRDPGVALPPPPETVRDAFTRKGLPSDEPERSTNDEPIIWFTGAKLSNHNESAHDENDRRMKGDSTEFLSYSPGEAGGPRGRQPGKTPGVNDNIGVGRGGGGAGRYGFRTGGKEDLIKIGDGGGTENAVTAALRWLARHQSADGSWSASGFSHKCAHGKCSGAGEQDFDTGVTSLSVLAFLGAGYSQLSRDELKDPVAPELTLSFGETVKKGLQWLTLRQDPAGCVGERGPKYMYNHAIAALALSEAYGMTAAPILKEPAQKAINFLVAAQNPGKGWRYSVGCRDNDTSVTGWAVMALKSAEISGLEFPKAAADGAIAWFNEATDQSGYYRTGYNQAGTGKVFVPGKNEQFADHPSMSAVAVMSRIFIEKRRSPALSAVNSLVSDLPAWKTGQVDFYYWYYGSLAVFQYDGPKGPCWAKWNEPMKNAIVPHQKTEKSGCENGSWDPSEDRWGFEGGRVYAAAINCLTLEVYYRYAHVFGGTNR
ncbi:MAG: terpene cyclase/mutase family protein [Planctomycetes bacterium]|nr:terpene cyclase/mutase family protein [Planctomycetota bacterium]